VNDKELLRRRLLVIGTLIALGKQWLLVVNLCYQVLALVDQLLLNLGRVEE
jgi:hypothetical protein